MRLTRVDIKNFRSIAYVSIDFDPRLRILVGVNEAGKSNVLSALSLLDPKRVVSAGDVREYDAEEAQDQHSLVRFVFNLDDADRKAVSARLDTLIFPVEGQPLVSFGGKSYSCQEYVASVKQGLHGVQIPSGLRSYVSWNLEDGAVIAEGWLKSSAKSPPAQSVNAQRSEVSTSHVFLMHEASVAEAELSQFEPATLADFLGIFNKALGEVMVPQLPECLYWSYSEKYLLPSSVKIEEFRSNPQSCEPLRQMFKLGGFSDVDDAFEKAERRPHGTRNLLEKISTKATQHLRSAWKDFSSLQITLYENGPKIDISVKDAHNHYSVESRSDGFKRFVSFLLLISARAKTSDLKNALYLQDEPDLGLHPSGVKYLLKELISLSSANYVVVSTHSIFLVDKERIDRHIIVNKKEERTSLSKIDSSNITDEEVIFNALGYSMFEGLRPMNVVFEGWRDKRMFAVYCASAKGKAAGCDVSVRKVGLCHAKGVKDVPRVCTMLELHGRSAIVVSDADAPAKQAKARFEREGSDIPWLCYDLVPGLEGGTAEDFIQESHLKKSFAFAQADCAISVSGAVDFTKKPVVASVDEQLRAAGLDKDARQVLANAWKSRIFESLVAADIEPSYDSVVKAVFQAALPDEGAPSTEG